MSKKLEDFSEIHFFSEAGVILHQAVKLHNICIFINFGFLMKDKENSFILRILTTIHYSKQRIFIYFKIWL